MLCVWRHGANTSYAIHREVLSLHPSSSLALTTITTYLSRLVDKGYLRAERRGSSTLLTYVPTVAFPDSLRRETLRFCVDYFVGDSLSRQILNDALSTLPVEMETVL